MRFNYKHITHAYISVELFKLHKTQHMQQSPPAELHKAGVIAHAEVCVCVLCVVVSLCWCACLLRRVAGVPAL